MLPYLASDLMSEIEIAKWCLENHHVNCTWKTRPDLEAEESESCAASTEQFGKGYDRLTCFDHDKLREWSKLLEENPTKNYLFLPTRTIMSACGQNGEVWFIQDQIAFHLNCVPCVASMLKSQNERNREMERLRRLLRSTRRKNNQD